MGRRVEKHSYCPKKEASSLILMGNKRGTSWALGQAMARATAGRAGLPLAGSRDGAGVSRRE